MKQSTLLFTFFLLLNQLSAQEPIFNFVRLNSGDGLSQSSVISIKQSSTGIMWFGTRDGLNKYDGENFTVFRANPDDSTSLSNSDILDLALDKSDNVWIGTTNGLNYFDWRTETFQSFYEHPGLENSLANNTVKKILVDDSIVWIGTSGGLSVLNRATNTFKNYYHNSSDPGSLSNNQIKDIFKDSQGNVWVGTSKGIHLINEQNDELSIRRYHEVIADLEGLNVQTIEEGGDGYLYIGTKYQGIIVFSTTSPQIVRKIKFPSISHNDIRTLKKDGQGRIWAGSYDGLNIIDDQFRITQIHHDPYREQSLSKNTIKCLYLDQQRSMWVGTYYGGISMWNRANFNFQSISQIPGSNSLSYNVVSAMLAYKGDLLFATEGGGITIMKTDGTFQYLNTTNSQLPSENVKSLFLDGDQLLIGTFDAGFCIYNLKTGKFDYFSDVDSGLPHNSVYSITKAHNKYWIGTFGGGLMMLDLPAGESTVFKQETKKVPGLSDDQIRVVFSDHHENIWVGTQNGINLLRRGDIIQQTFRFQKFMFDQTTASGEDILTIFEDSKNRLWFGTKQKGLNVYKE
ncbi:MAG: two-component regulator propeller domain-containing protein, partial [Bacteroidota bacterium]